MADDLKPIADYHTTDWHNYLPPSIDQVNLNKLEEGMALNRNTINEIIRHLGVKPESISSEDEKVYDNPIYETLIKHRDELIRLEQDKADKSSTNNAIGDMTALIGGSNLVEAINNRLRRDVDDSANKTYTFKKLILNNGTSEALNVTGSARFSEAITTAGITSSGKINANNGIAVARGGTVSGGLTVDSLTVTGNVTIQGALQVNSTITANDWIWTKKSLWADEDCNVTRDVKVTKNVYADYVKANGDVHAGANIACSGAFHSKKEVIQFGWDTSTPHNLYVHGGDQAVSNLDAFIRTIN